MAHLIDKDALVAEIERTIDEPYPKHDQQCNWEDGYCGGLYKALSIIEDTSEVKEVDLEKTINDYFKDWTFDEELDIMVKPNNYSATSDDIKEVAKHFFELGLRVNNEKEK